MKTDNPDRHYYLYAKHHYKDGGIINDLKKITANRCGLCEKYVTVEDIIIVLSIITDNHINKLSSFIHRLNDKRRFYDKDTTEISIIKTMLSILAYQEVKNIPIELGEADENILPLSQGAKERQKEAKPCEK